MCQDSRGSFSTVPLYSALNLSVREMRLLELSKGEEDSMIEIGRCNVSLDECPPYTALSYRWGDDTRRKLIKVDGQIISVRENLWWFLRTVRSEQKAASYIWIDTLCI